MKATFLNNPTPTAMPYTNFGGSSSPATAGGLGALGVLVYLTGHRKFPSLSRADCFRLEEIALQQPWFIVQHFKSSDQSLYLLYDYTACSVHLSNSFIPPTGYLATASHMNWMSSPTKSRLSLIAQHWWPYMHKLEVSGADADQKPSLFSSSGLMAGRHIS